jgi:hypothetical protein
MGRRKNPPMSSDGRGACCIWCRRQLKATTDQTGLAATRDHVMPKSKWSAGEQPRAWACRTCNNMKADMLPAEWRQFRAANPEWWKGREQPLQRAATQPGGAP